MHDFIDHFLVFNAEFRYFFKNLPRTPLEKSYWTHIVEPFPQIITLTEKMEHVGLKQWNALHVACTIHGGCGYFLTVDHSILKKGNAVPEIVVVSPIDFFGYPQGGLGMTETEIKLKGMEALHKYLGLVEAERFVSLSSETFANRKGI